MIYLCVLLLITYGNCNSSNNINSTNINNNRIISNTAATVQIDKECDTRWRNKFTNESMFKKFIRETYNMNVLRLRFEENQDINESIHDANINNMSENSNNNISYFTNFTKPYKLNICILNDENNVSGIKMMFLDKLEFSLLFDLSFRNIFNAEDYDSNEDDVDFCMLTLDASIVKNENDVFRQFARFWSLRKIPQFADDNESKVLHASDNLCEMLFVVGNNAAENQMIYDMLFSIGYDDDDNNNDSNKKNEENIDNVETKDKIENSPYKNVILKLVKMEVVPIKVTFKSACILLGNKSCVVNDTLSSHNLTLNYEIMEKDIMDKILNSTKNTHNSLSISNFLLLQDLDKNEIINLFKQNQVNWKTFNKLFDLRNINLTNATITPTEQTFNTITFNNETPTTTATTTTNISIASIVRNILVNLKAYVNCLKNQENQFNDEYEKIRDKLYISILIVTFIVFLLITFICLYVIVLIFKRRMYKNYYPVSRYSHDNVYKKTTLP